MSLISQHFTLIKFTNHTPLLSFSLLSDLFKRFSGSRSLAGFTYFAVGTGEGVTKNDVLLHPNHFLVTKNDVLLRPTVWCVSKLTFLLHFTGKPLMKNSFAAPLTCEMVRGERILLLLRQPLRPTYHWGKKPGLKISIKIDFLQQLIVFNHPETQMD